MAKIGSVGIGDVYLPSQEEDAAYLNSLVQQARGVGPAAPDPVGTTATTAAVPATQTQPDPTIGQVTDPSRPMPVADFYRSAPISRTMATQLAQRLSGEAGVSPETREHVADTRTAVNADLATGGQLQSDKLKGFANIEGDLLSKLETQQTNADLRRYDREQDMRSLFNKYNEVNDENSKYVEDPNKAWNSLDTGAQVTALIGTALLGFASGFNKTPNQAFDQLNRFADRQLAADRAMHSAKVDANKARGNLYIMMRNAGFDDDVASAARMNQLKEAAVLQTQKLAHEIGSTEAVNQANLLIDRIRQGQAEDQMGIEKGVGAMAARLQLSSSGGGQRAHAGTIDIKNAVPLSDGRYVKIDSPEVYNELIKKNGFRANQMSVLGDLINLERNRPAKDKINAWNEYNAKRDSLVSELARLNNSDAGQGAMQGEDRKVAESAVAALSGPSRYNVDTVSLLTNVKQRIDRSWDEKVAATGGTVLTKRLAVLPNGKIEEQYMPSAMSYGGKPDVNVGPVK